RLGRATLIRRRGRSRREERAYTAWPPPGLSVQSVTTVRHRSWFEVPAPELFAFHLRVANVARIQPPLPRIRLIAGAPLTQEGDLQEFELALGPLRRHWTARITRVVDGRGFEDVQL